MMDQQRWRQIDGVLQAVLERPPAERASFLDEACADDESLRSEVESLLSSGDRALSFLDQPALEAAAGLLSEHYPELVPGQLIGHYKILSFLGAGGMGEIYLAEDSRLGRKVALKSLPPSFIRNESRVSRFRQEARAASALNHPNILTIYDIDEFDGRQFIAMEFIDGETLRHRIQRERLRLNESLDTVIQVASALAAAHEAGIVHRDIKPENIMLRRDGYVKVLDFGLAKLNEPPQSFFAGPDAPTLDKLCSAPGVIMGTVTYMSPEQARGIEVDCRSDIFSLGVVLYEIITGRAPFNGETPSDVLASILKVEPPPLTTDSADVPGELQGIISNALRKDRDERYQTIGEMLAEIKALKWELEIEDRPYPSAKRSSNEVATVETQVQATPQTVDETAAQTGDTAVVHTALSKRPFIGVLKYRSKATQLVAILAIVVIAAGSYLVSRLVSHSRTTLFENFQITKLTTAGKARDAAISPDGKYVGYVVVDRGQESIWIKQLATGSTAQIVPPGAIRLAALTFSPDSNNLFYVRYDEKNSATNALHRVSVLGGPSTKTTADVHCPISFSPDGKQFTFFRRFSEGRDNALIIANLDGTEEEELARQEPPERFTDYPCGPAWSPDGKVIACGVSRHRDDGSLNIDLVEVRVADGTQGTISSNQWKFFAGLSWLSDGNSLLVSAGAGPRPPGTTQVWQVSYPGGEIRRVTNDVNDYVGMSITADSTLFVAHQGEARNNIWIAPIGNTTQAKPVTTGGTRITGVSWTPDGSIVFAQETSNKPDIWITDQDGNNQTQLTFEGRNHSPCVTAYGRYIVYISDNDMRKMDIDGNNRKVIARVGYNTWLRCTPDGKEIIFFNRSSLNVLWKMSIDGNAPVQLTQRKRNSAYLTPDISPDGKWVAYTFMDEKTNPTSGIEIIPIEGGEPVRRIHIPWHPSSSPDTAVRWSHDGNAIMYTNAKDGIRNIWSIPVAGGPPKQLTDFKSDGVWDFERSIDGKKLACVRSFWTSDVILVSNAK